MFSLSKHISSCVFRNGAANCSRILNKSSPTTLKTYAPQLSSANVKTPVQALGYDYLYQQKALNRPLSPFIMYKPQLTWMLSGINRITGITMGVTVGLLSAAMLMAPVDFPQLIESIRLAGLPPAFVATVKFWIAWPLTYHLLNGLRTIGFDLAVGIDLPTIYKSGWLVLGTSLIIAVILTFWRKSDKETIGQK